MTRADTAKDPPAGALEIPELCLVVLIGASGSGKSSFARRHFAATEVISSDTCRGLVCDDETDQGATGDAFELLRYLAGKRLARRRLTVIDATSVSPEARAQLIAVAKAHHVLPVAIVLDVPPSVCIARNKSRPDRPFGGHVVRRQYSALRRSLRGLKREGFRRIHRLRGAAEVEAASVVRARLWNDRRDARGPFDIIGDIHGCHEELLELLAALGYTITGDPDGDPIVTPPEGRTAVFVGDLVDRGPAAQRVLRLVMGMVSRGAALCVCGNHEAKLTRWLKGKRVKLSHGLDRTVAQLEGETKAFRDHVTRFVDRLISHYVLDEGRLVVAHAGLREELQGRTSGAVRAFCMYGETKGETDSFGLPIRANWAADYRGRAMVVYGHTPVPEARWLNNTICVDTGCVFGGKLTALRYPERELVSVPARAVHYPPARPLEAAAQRGFEREDDLLDLGDVTGRRVIDTRALGPVRLRPEQSIAALETISRFAVDPHWLIYLPPTMSPPETCPEGPLLERPREALEYFATRGVRTVLCQEKHMGSRAIIVVCRDTPSAQKRFNARDGRDGIVYTRTGRRFFNDAALESALLGLLRRTLERAGVWARLETDWLCLDAELMPWSLKSRALLRSTYAAVSAAARASLLGADAPVRAALQRAGLDDDSRGRLDALRRRLDARQRMLAGYDAAWRRYCWPTRAGERERKLEGIRLAPFHLLASEGAVHTDKPHTWHLEQLQRIAEHDDTGLLQPTRARQVALDDPESVSAAERWWSELTEAGGEGVVIKPLDWIVRDARPGKRGLVQPALKCRGREYLRIIYGPEYSAPEHLERLRVRGLKRKRALAIREYALGLEGLRRFVDREPLHRVHECAFGVLSLEADPVDPRL